MAIPLWTNDQNNGGTMFVVSAVSTYDGGVMLGDFADRVTYTATASPGTDTIGQHFPRMQLEIPSGTTAHFIIRKDGFLHDEHTFVGPQTPAYMDYFNFDQYNNEQNGLLNYFLEDGEVATIECWSEHTDGDQTPLLDVEKAVLTIIDVGYSSTEVPSPCTKPSSTLDGTDATPLNPGNVTVVARTTINHLGASLATETMYVVDDIGSTAIPMPLAGDKLDMSQWVGKTVTIHYSATDDCVNGDPSDEDTFNVTVPAWKQIITVDQNSPVTATNKHVIRDGLIALTLEGSLFEVYPPIGGTWLIHTTNPVQGRISLTKNNCTFKFIGSMTIDGNKNNAGTNNGVILTNGANNCLIDGGADLTVTNGNRNGVSTGSLTSGTTIKNIKIDACHLYGMQLVSCTDTVVENVDTFDTVVIGGFAAGLWLGAGQAGSGVTNALIINCESYGNNDGFVITEGLNNGALFKDCYTHDNARQGFLCEDGGDSISWVGGEVADNNQAGIQIENGTTNFIVRGASVHGNNIYLGGGGGEVGIWCDDSTTGLVEDNDVYDNGGGIKIDSDSTFQTSGVIVRRNKVRQNNGPGAASGLIQAMMFRGSDKCYVYNNTFWQNGRVDAQGENGGMFTMPAQGAQGQTNTNLAFRNNIVGKTIRKDGDTMQVNLILGNEFADLDYNWYFDPPQAIGYTVAQVPMNYAAYRTHMKDNFNQEIHSNEFDTEDPLLNDTTLVPSAGSPVLGMSKKLTSITAINGLEIDLALPGFFWKGDRIEFEDRSTALITDVTLTSVFVDAVPASVAVGQDVDLYGLNNIGAVQ